eukprot:483783_1
MAQFFVETSTGQNEGQNDDDLTSWIKQNHLPGTIAQVLQENEIFSLQDLTIFESEQEIKEFINSLGLKVITRKKFNLAVNKLMKQKENERFKFQDSSRANDNENKQNIMSSQKQIQWKSITLPSSQKISIESNKNEDIKIKQIDKEEQKTMSEDRKDILGGMKNGYFSDMHQQIADCWNQNKALGIWSGVSNYIYTGVPFKPVGYAIDYIRQSQHDQNVSDKKEVNNDIKEFNRYLKKIKDLETLILSKRDKLKEQEQ